ncbi:hypothetical protein BT96DRAFT_1006568 [Gymnopus androsaceus JB14]|uniref:Uncharacterized protein n=1 Tax=Gymnopus androsaceus JB14 TaxID=1447944 RepID=A0A6A4GJT0_9AGAR|nr:hypothetical protein BT96DRAFT_1006568 [Gymnopus androsaceus JB14]
MRTLPPVLTNALASYPHELSLAKPANTTLINLSFSLAQNLPPVLTNLKEASIQETIISDVSTTSAVISFMHFPRRMLGMLSQTIGFHQRPENNLVAPIVPAEYPLLTAQAALSAESIAHVVTVPIARFAVYL